MRQPSRRPQQRSELAEALAACRGAFISIGLMAGMSNILMLTGAFFMLEIYDRVLPSRSIPTLVGLVILAGGLYTAQGLLDLIRGRILVRIGGRLDEALSGRVYETIVRLPLKVGNRNDGLQPLRDLDSVRSFLSGSGPNALFDLPWLPVYLVGMGLIVYVSDFGPLKNPLLPLWWDMLAVVAFSLAVYFWALHVALPVEKIERMIDEDPDLAPRTETLQPLLGAKEIRRKLGLTQQEFAKKLGVPLATVRAWERDETPADPLLQALLRILDRIPEPALRALDEVARKAG
jgi:DNA-binding transcriptional regulator YiaG